jgi:hypothetical protein
MNNKERAKRLARTIFEAPYGIDPNKVQRIQFKGGQSPNETDLGGLCEGALADLIKRFLDNE